MDSKKDETQPGLTKTKENLKIVGEKIGKLFEEVGKNTKELLNLGKQNLKLTAEKIDHKFKEKYYKKMEKETKKWAHDPRILALKKVLQPDFQEVKEDTAQIKQDTHQIKEELAEILSVLEILDYKSDKVEAYLIQIAPQLEQILEDIENLEDYIKANLGSKWKKLRHTWKKYKKGKISRAEFIVHGFKTLGVAFVSVFKPKI